MNTGIYGIAGAIDDRTKNDGKIDREDEVYAFLKGMPAAASLVQLLARSPVIIEVTDIKALSADLLEALRPGDIVVKVTGTDKHSYRVSYKGASGLCLTYADCENVETVAYEKTGDTWAWDSTDVTHIGE